MGPILFVIYIGFYSYDIQIYICASNLNDPFSDSFLHECLEYPIFLKYPIGVKKSTPINFVLISTTSLNKLFLILD